MLDPTGTITFDGPGTLTIASGGLFKMTADTASVAIDNQGNLDIESGTSTIDNSINTFTHSGVLTIRGTSSGDAELSVANGFTSAGTITLDNAHSTGRNQTLTVSSGTLTNTDTGTISTTQTGNGGGTWTINANIINEGMIDIDATATVIATTFDTSDGDIDVASGNTLYLDSTTTTIGASTNLTGLGTIDLLGNQTVNFASAYTISDTSTLLDPTGTITFDGPGTLTIASGGLFKMTADTASVAIDNQGNLDIESGTSTIDNSINTFTHSGVLTIRGTSSGMPN